jgi:hypothetical protein
LAAPGFEPRKQNRDVYTSVENKALFEGCRQPKQASDFGWASAIIVTIASYLTRQNSNEKKRGEK